MFRYDLASWLFRRRFGANGGYSYCSFMEHWGGYCHSVYLTIEPAESVAATRDQARARFCDLCLWLRAFRLCFRRNDRCQIVVGVPLDIKSGGNQIFKGWLPVTALRNLHRVPQSLDLESLGGGCSELSNWTMGLFDENECETGASHQDQSEK